MHSQSTDSVTFEPAMYGMPATVIILRGGTVQVESFGVGHVFTDNANAREYALRMSLLIGVPITVER